HNSLHDNGPNAVPPIWKSKDACRSQRLPTACSAASSARKPNRGSLEARVFVTRISDSPVFWLFVTGECRPPCAVMSTVKSKILYILQLAAEARGEGLLEPAPP